MELSLKFKYDSECRIIIEDTTKYDPEDRPGTGYNSWKNSDTGSIFVLGYHKVGTDDEIEYLNPKYISKHTSNRKYKINIPKDGWITLYHIILPTKETLERISKEGLNNKYTFYIDNDKIYKNYYENSEVKNFESSVDEILMFNKNLVVGTFIYEQDYISICNLNKCYVNLSLDVFKNLDGFGQCFKNNLNNSDIVLKRDIIWMAINVINYMIKYNMKAEAARIINQLEGCNGICNSNNKTKTVSRCGCSR